MPALPLPARRRSRRLRARTASVLVGAMGALPSLPATVVRADERPVVEALAESPTGTLRLADAVALGVRVHPTLTQAAANRDAAVARVGEAYSGYLPQVGLAGLARVDASNYSPVVAGTPLGGNSVSFPFTVSGRYSATLNVSQTLYDFGRTGWAVDAARQLARAAGEDALTARLTVELGVVNAYFQVLQAQALARVADEALAQVEEHVKQSTALFRVGTRPEMDVVSAETQRAQARLQIVQARNGVRSALLSLGAAMGVVGEPRFTVEETPIAPIPGEEGDVESLLKEALARRPEYRSLALQLAAAEAQVKQAQAGYFPTIGVSGLASASGTDAVPGPLWDFAAQLTVSQSIFSGWLTKRTVEENRAQARAASAQVQALALSVRLAVAQAQLSVQASIEALTAAAAVEEQAGRQLAMAQGRYRAGVGTIIELVDAQQGAVSARAQRVQADYTLATSRAALARTLGRDLGPPVSGGGRTQQEAVVPKGRNQP